MNDTPNYNWNNPKFSDIPTIAGYRHAYAEEITTHQPAFLDKSLEDLGEIVEATELNVLTLSGNDLPHPTPSRGSDLLIGAHALCSPGNNDYNGLYLSLSVLSERRIVLTITPNPSLSVFYLKSPEILKKQRIIAGEICCKRYDRDLSAKVKERMDSANRATNQTVLGEIGNLNVYESGVSVHIGSKEVLSSSRETCVTMPFYSGHYRDMGEMKDEVRRESVHYHLNYFLSSPESYFKIMKKATIELIKRLGWVTPFTGKLSLSEESGALALAFGGELVVVKE